MADVRSFTPLATLSVNGDEGGDTVHLDQVGYQSTTTFEGGIGRDIVYVAGEGIPVSATVTLHGNAPSGVPASQGDILNFDPGNATKASLPIRRPRHPMPGPSARAMAARASER